MSKQEIMDKYHSLLVARQYHDLISPAQQQYLKDTCDRTGKVLDQIKNNPDEIRKMGQEGMTWADRAIYTGWAGVIQGAGEVFLGGASYLTGDLGQTILKGYSGISSMIEAACKGAENDTKGAIAKSLSVIGDVPFQTPAQDILKTPGIIMEMKENADKGQWGDFAKSSLDLVSNGMGLVNKDVGEGLGGAAMIAGGALKAYDGARHVGEGGETKDNIAASTKGADMIATKAIEGLSKTHEISGALVKFDQLGGQGDLQIQQLEEQNPGLKGTQDAAQITREARGYAQLTDDFINRSSDRPLADSQLAAKTPELTVPTGDVYIPPSSTDNGSTKPTTDCQSSTSSSSKIDSNESSSTDSGRSTGLFCGYADGLGSSGSSDTQLSCEGPNNNSETQSSNAPAAESSAANTVGGTSRQNSGNAAVCL